MKPTVGIIGGSGPLATIDIEQKILSITKKLAGALTDQDYFNLVVFNYCGTYDRNDAVFFGKPDPLAQYRAYISSIEALGVNLILLACNTAHMYLPFLKEKMKTPIMSIIEETRTYLQANFPTCSKVGLIATKATQEKKLYHKLFEKNGIDIIDINPSTQDSVMKAIYLIKSGIDLTHEDEFIANDDVSLNISIEQNIILKNHPYKKILIEPKLSNPRLLIKEAIAELEKKGCRHIIFGCTELPLVIPYLKKEFDLHFIDPNAITAEAVVLNLMEIENQFWANRRIYVNERRYT